jgi:predicted esterase YcpF (UPF0227 family)
MPALVYLHGFLSSPLSIKARQTEAWLKAHRPDISYHCPFISSYPGDARISLEKLLADIPANSIGLVGSSLGGFWATYLAEIYGLRAVLVNPAVRPQDRFAEFVGRTLKSYHSDDEYRLTQADMQELIKTDLAPCKPARYWVMLQTGDETLDYRQAIEKYEGSRLLVEEGGSHAFDGFEQWLPQLVEFLFEPEADPR